MQKLVIAVITLGLTVGFLGIAESMIMPGDMGGGSSEMPVMSKPAPDFGSAEAKDVFSEAPQRNKELNNFIPDFGSAEAKNISPEMTEGATETIPNFSSAEGNIIELKPLDGEEGGGEPSVQGPEKGGEAENNMELDWSEPVDSSYADVATFDEESGNLNGGALYDALNSALQNGSITQDQFDQAASEIKDFLAQYPDIADANVTMQTVELPEGTATRFNIEGYGTIEIYPGSIVLNFVDQKQAGVAVSWGEKGFRIDHYNPDEQGA